MDLNEIAMFVKVAETGSFTKAAEALGVTKSTISMRVLGLERQLSTALLHRTTRRMRLTEEGEKLFRTCAGALQDIESAKAHVDGKRIGPSGVLKVSAPMALGTYLLPSFLESFLEKYPGITLELNLSNQFVDLIADGIDVAIRAGHLKDSTLIAKKIGTSYLALYASPRYLKRHGKPQSPKDLAAHPCLKFRAAGGEWVLSKGNRSAKVRIESRIEVDDLTALKEMTVAGIGIGLFPSFVAQPELASGKLRPVLEGWRALPTGVFVVYPGQRHQPPKLKVFVEEVTLAMRKAFSDEADA